MPWLEGMLAKAQSTSPVPTCAYSFDTFAFEPLAWSPEEITRNAQAKSKIYGELVKRGNISLD